MVKYINTDVLEKSLDEQLKRIRLSVTNDNLKLTCALLVYGIHLDIENTPAADVVEVVRCKDCQYWKTETEPIGIECEPGEDAHYCDMGGITRSADYCSYGDHK